MKPIIITIVNGKVSMTPEEFKRHMDNAYNQGYCDGSSTLTLTSDRAYPNNDPNWWKYVTCSTDTACDAATKAVL